MGTPPPTPLLSLSPLYANARATARVDEGCLTDDDSCGCAWSKCRPYHSLPCHNARESYECKSYDISEHMQRCGY